MSMNINEEKAMIYSMMNNLTAERRKITDMYGDLKKRLDELILLETRGLEDLSIQGYVDIRNNKMKSLSVENVEREMNKIIKNIETDFEPKEKEIIPKREIDIEKEKLPKKSSVINIDKAVGAISTVLKEKGEPMQVKDIHEQVEEALEVTIKLANFRNNILPRACKKNPKIQRAMRGYYQYVY